MVSSEVGPPGESSPSPSPGQGVASSSGGASSSGIGGGHQTRRKRGRPKKYRPDGGVVLALTAPSASPADAPPPPSTAANVAETATESSKKRGYRPSCSSQSRQMEAPDSTEDRFVAHVIRVKAGQDVSAKIMEFSQQSSCATCVLSATGAISHITLSLPAVSGGTVTFQGRFDIISLTGSFLPSKNGSEFNCGGESKNGDKCSQTSPLCVSLSGLDNNVFGGLVAGIMTAASTVQNWQLHIVLGSFRYKREKENPRLLVLNGLWSSHGSKQSPQELLNLIVATWNDRDVQQSSPGFP